jgi:hypothetical protein
MKIFTGILVLCGVSVGSYFLGVYSGAETVGSSQAAAEEKTLRWWGSTPDPEPEEAQGGFCWSCSEHAGSRGWSWMFGWGACPCHTGWTGACCDVSTKAVEGGWSEWSEPGECSDECGTGTATYTRTCDNPKPKVSTNPNNNNSAPIPSYRPPPAPPPTL